MNTSVTLYSDVPHEIERFLELFYEEKFNLDDDLKWEKSFENPVEMSGIIGTLNDNNDKFKINMWVTLDKGFFINVTNYNVNKIIRYLYERYPY